MRDVLQQKYERANSDPQLSWNLDFFADSTIAYLLIAEYEARNRCTAYLRNLTHLEKRCIRKFKLNVFPYMN